MKDWQCPTAEESPPLAAESDWTKPTPTASRSRTPRGRLHDNSWTTPTSQSQSSSGNSWTRPAPAVQQSAEVAEVKAKGRRQATLGLEILSFAQRQSGKGNESAYAKNGRSRSRIRRVLQGIQKSCSPACQQRCRERVRPAELQAICDMYWSLKAEDQSYLAGLPVCPTSELRVGGCCTFVQMESGPTQQHRSPH